MQALKKHWPTILIALGGLTAVGSEAQQYLATDKTPTSNELIAAAGVALMTYLMKRPGDLTKEQAEAHAEKAVRASQLPPLDDR